MGIGCVGEESWILNFVDCIGSVGEQLIFNSLELVANDECLKFYAEAVGKLASFGEEFEADVGNMPVVKFAIYYKVVLVFCHDVLSDGVVGDKFLYEILELDVVVVEASAFLCGENYVFDRLYFCGRTGHADLLGICVNKCRTPFL